MAEVPEINVEQIMAQIRENIRKRRQEFSPPEASGRLGTLLAESEADRAVLLERIERLEKQLAEAEADRAARLEVIQRLEKQLAEILPPPNSLMASELAALHHSANIYQIHLTSHRRILGTPIISAKKVLRKLLMPILERQSAYNAANDHVTAYLCRQVEGLQAFRVEVVEQVREVGERQAEGLQALRAEVAEQVREVGERQAEGLQALRAEVAEQVREVGERQAEGLQALRAEVAEQAIKLGRQLEDGFTLRDTRITGLEQTVNGTHDSIISYEQVQQENLSRFESIFMEKDARVVDLERSTLQLKANLIRQERRITMLLEEARKRLPKPLDQEQLQIIADEAKDFLDALYVAFEDQFRGTRQDIKARLLVYLPIIKEAKLGTEEMPILDVGCGRGEWLELLQEEEDARAWGVDLNRVLVEGCRLRGLEVVQGDVIAYLHSLPDASLGAVTGFHIIEHLPFEVLIQLLDETVRVLKSGGLAIFETPNPENVLVGSHTFYLDPTHRNPLPSATVKFLAEARGLCRVEVLNLHPYPEALRVTEAGLEVAKQFNEYFYGPRDYAVVAWKV
jgi:O-antigen chain-terminating methyltransferase